MVADQVGSTPHVDRLGLLPAAEAQFAINCAIRLLLERRDGRWVKGTGDGFLATFGNLYAALNTASDLQCQQTFAESVPPPAYRVGIASGEIAIGPDDIYGLPIIVAERLRQLAREGEVLVAAGDASELSEIPHLITRGRLALKGICDPVAAHSYGWAGRRAMLA
jgi:class 3 adenylate cyclase